jgi:hypothetical protein
MIGAANWQAKGGEEADADIVHLGTNPTQI